MSSILWKRATIINRALFPTFENLKQGRLAKGFDLIRDYKQAFVDLFKYAKDKPLIATVQVSAIGFSLLAASKNPNMLMYEEKLLDASNKHSLISDLIRNKKSSNKIKLLIKYRSEDRLRVSNFFVCSFVMLQVHPEGFDSYDKHCATLHSRWLHWKDWKNRIVDYGFFNRWYMLKQIMMNYDVNEDEY